MQIIVLHKTLTTNSTLHGYMLSCIHDEWDKGSPSGKCKCQVKEKDGDSKCSKSTGAKKGNDAEKIKALEKQLKEKEKKLQKQKKELKQYAVAKKKKKSCVDEMKEDVLNFNMDDFLNKKDNKEY